MTPACASHGRYSVVDAVGLGLRCGYFQHNNHITTVASLRGPWRRRPQQDDLYWSVRSFFSAYSTACSSAIARPWAQSGPNASLARPFAGRRREPVVVSTVRARHRDAKRHPRSVGHPKETGSPFGGPPCTGFEVMSLEVLPLPAPPCFTSRRAVRLLRSPGTVASAGPRLAT
jgi:hypothetical protein